MLAEVKLLFRRVVIINNNACHITHSKYGNSLKYAYCVVRHYDSYLSHGVDKVLNNLLAITIICTFK